MASFAGTPRRSGGASPGSPGRRQRANAISAAVTGLSDGNTELSAADRWLTRPVTRLMTAAAVLAAIWWVLGGLVAGKLVGFTEGIVMNRWVIPPLTRALNVLLPRGGCWPRAGGRGGRADHGPCLWPGPAPAGLQFLPVAGGAGKTQVTCRAWQ